MWWKHEAWKEPWHVGTHGCTNVSINTGRARTIMLSHTHVHHTFISRSVPPGESELVTAGVFGTGISAARPRLIFLPDFWLLCQQDRLRRTSLDGC